LIGGLSIVTRQYADERFVMRSCGAFEGALAVVMAFSSLFFDVSEIGLLT